MSDFPRRLPHHSAPMILSAVRPVAVRLPSPHETPRSGKRGARYLKGKDLWLLGAEFPVPLSRPGGEGILKKIVRAIGESPVIWFNEGTNWRLLAVGA